MSYLQAIVIAVVQGVTELFPVSSLGHSVLVPAWLGGSWETLVTQSSQATSETSFYLAYIVALHCATALALLWFFRADWVRISRGFLRSAAPASRARGASDARSGRAAGVADRDRDDPGRHHRPRARARLPDRVRQAARGERLPVRQRPDPARRRARCAAAPWSAGARRATGRGVASASGASRAGARRCVRAPARRASRVSDERCAIGLLQIAALLPGISRSGITMVGGLWRGLDHEDAARFAFLLATP